MPLSGKISSNRSVPTKSAYFLLDECLPYTIGDFLHELGYPIITWHEEFKGQQGYEDTPLIQYLGAKHYSWITKDDKAKAEHERDIRTAGISVVWIRGLERDKGKAKKNKISNKDVHRMLTDKLEILQQEVSSSKSAQYFLMSFKTGYRGEIIPIERQITLDYFFNKHLPKLNRSNRTY